MCMASFDIHLPAPPKEEVGGGASVRTPLQTEPRHAVPAVREVAHLTLRASLARVPVREGGTGPTLALIEPMHRGAPGGEHAVLGEEMGGPLSRATVRYHQYLI